MTARGSTSKMFGDWKDIVSQSHIFLPVKSADEEILPCIHVLCNGCLETIPSRTGKKSGDKMVCKVCRLDFVIPSSKVLRERKATKELLYELSRAANDVKHWCEICRENYPRIWNEMNGQSALMYCEMCGKYECLVCAKKHCSYHQTIPMRSHLTEKPTKHGSHERHTKRLEVYCIACDKADCFLCLVDNVPYQMRNDFDKALGLDVELGLQSLNALSKQFSDSKAQVEEQARQFESSVTKVKNQVEASYEEHIRALENQKKSHLNELRSIDTKVKEQFKQRRTAIDTLSKKADSFSKSYDSIKLTGKLEEKFCAVGVVLNKIDELKRELESSIKHRLPAISYDLEKSFETRKIEMHWIDERPNDDAITDADRNTKKEETTNETVGNMFESGRQVPTSMQGDCTVRSQNVTTTLYMHVNADPNYKGHEDSKTAFPEVLAKYKEMLEKMRNRMIPDKIRTKAKQRTSLLKKEDTEKLRQQFDHVRRTRTEKMETTQWRSIERCHEQLANLACREAEGDSFSKILDEVNGIIEDMLKQIAAMGDADNETKKDETTNEPVGNRYDTGHQVTPPMPEKRSQQGLRNFGNTCYFNAVIQCLCQTFHLLEELSSRNISTQPLTEAFVEFFNYKSAAVGAHEQNAAFSKFFEQLYRSLPKFNNFQQHDSHDLFIHFLNDLRSEERLHTAQNIDPKKVLTAVDKVFGGHFVTMYACLNCHQPYFVCECLLDISLPICVPKKQQQQQWPYSGEGSGGTYQMSGNRDRGSTVDKHQNRGSYSCQDKESTLLLEALNEEPRIPADEGRRYNTRPITLADCLRFYTATEHIPEGYLCLSCQDGNQSAAAVNAQTMPPALKRTLIYNPPAILVLHMKRFERTATGFMKRSDRVSYEELLDLGPYCSSDCLRIDPEDKNVWYSLYGVVVHSGSLECGHYIAYVKKGDSNAESAKAFLQEKFLNRDAVAIEQKNKLSSRGERAGRKVKWQPKPATDGKWIYVSDSNARDATSDEVLSQEAFMLFYERVPKPDQ